MYVEDGEAFYHREKYGEISEASAGGGAPGTSADRVRRIVRHLEVQRRVQGYFG